MGLRRVTQAGRIDTSRDAPGRGVDSDDRVALEDIGVDLAADAFQLVQIRQRRPVDSHRHLSDHGERLAVPESQHVGTVTHYESAAVVAKPPAFAPVAERSEAVEVRPEDERLFGLPSQHDQALSLPGEPLAEEEHRNPHTVLDGSRGGVDSAQLGLPAPSGALVELALPPQETLGECRRVVRDRAVHVDGQRLHRGNGKHHA